MLCSCPESTALTTVSNPTCIEDFGEWYKFFSQRFYSTGATRNSFVVASDDPTLLATWSSFLGAADGTKIIQTPDLEGWTFAGSEPRTTGGGEESRGGVEIVKGATPQQVNCYLNEAPAYIAAQLRNLMCERYFGIYPVNEHGQIGALTDKTDGSTPTIYYPIPVARRTFFVGDKQFGHYQNRDRNMIQFYFLPNTFDTFQVINPADFDPRLYIS